MNISRRSFGVLVCVLCTLSTPAAADDAQEVRELTARAEGMLWLGVAENVSLQEFVEALEVLDRAGVLAKSAGLTLSDRLQLLDEIEALSEDLKLNIERSKRSFSGSFPLARLLFPIAVMAEQKEVTEIRVAPANQAVRRAAERVVQEIVRFRAPRVVFRSMPRNRAFEVEAMRAFALADRPFAQGRLQLVSELAPEQLAAFDRGEMDGAMVERLLRSLGGSELLVLTMRAERDLPDDGSMVQVDGQ